MTQTYQPNSLKSSACYAREQIETFARENRRALQIAGAIAAVGVAGTLGSLLLLKGVAAAKGAAAAQAALAAKGTTATSGGAAGLASQLAPQALGTIGATAANPIAANVSLPLATLLGGSAGMGIVDSGGAGLMGVLSRNFIPLAGLAVGGGVVGYNLAWQRTRSIQYALDTQIETAEMSQAETEQAQSTLSTIETNLSDTQAKLDAQIAATKLAETEKVQSQSLLGATKDNLNDLQAKLDAQTSAAKLARAETAKLQRILKATEANLLELQAKRKEKTTKPPAHERLDRIHGIGRAFAKRLNEAGIHTITELAEQTVESLEDIVGKKRTGATFQPEAWIEEARQLIGKPQMVVAASPALFATQLVVSDNITQDETMLILERLEIIDGITPTIAAYLNQSGILTYEDLAQQEPTNVESMIAETPRSDDQNVEDWVMAARALAKQK
ncbi:MAG: helix-hairpin-helix domain-containing protein [Chloroflexota bacterium]